jgi:hypothetical protein
MKSISWKDYVGVLSGCRGNKMGKDTTDPMCSDLNVLFDDLAIAHPWFIREHIEYAFQTLVKPMDKEKPCSPSSGPLNNKTLAFWLRPLSPFDGLELILSGLHAGFRCVIRTNEVEKPFYKGILGLLQAKFPKMEERIEFIDHPFGEVDAYVIVGESPTPSQLTYFENKPVFLDSSVALSAVAVITGNENCEELDLLATDLCMYFGRSKYNTAELLVPKGYDFVGLLKSMENYSKNAHHSRYFNHYEYRKAAFLVSGEAFIDNGFLLFIKDKQHARHIGVVGYNEYEGICLPEINTKARQLFKAEPALEDGELPFGNALGQRYLSVDRFLVFLAEV